MAGFQTFGRGRISAFADIARAAIHRFQKQHRQHPQWKAWWDSLRGNPAVEFFRVERDWILKEAPPKIGQKIFMPSIGLGGTHTPAYRPSKAAEFYYFESPDVEATPTVGRHLSDLEQLLKEVEVQLTAFARARLTF